MLLALGRGEKKSCGGVPEFRSKRGLTEDKLTQEDVTFNEKVMGIARAVSGLRQAAHESSQTVKKATLSTGPELTDWSETPYEMEASGFLTALERRGAFSEKNQIGLVGVISDNFRSDLTWWPPVLVRSLKLSSIEPC